ncbi:MAG: hypothetical protein ACKVU0_09605 [Saprospiraceae bacterium]
MKNFFYSLPAEASAKAGSFFIVLLCLQACSQSPGSDASNKTADSLLNDPSAVLGSSPDNAYRLFKSARQLGEQTVTDLILVRLRDSLMTAVSTIPAKDSLPREPKFFWSKDSKYLLVNNSVPDSTYHYEVVLFDLQNLAVAQRNFGELVNYDKANDVVFFYKSLPTRQSISYYYLENPSKESGRDVTVVPIGKLPNLILSVAEKEARVKAYTIDNTPVNFAFKYN